MIIWPRILSLIAVLTLAAQPGNACCLNGHNNSKITGQAPCHQSHTSTLSNSCHTPASPPASSPPASSLPDLPPPDCDQCSTPLVTINRALQTDFGTTTMPTPNLQYPAPEQTNILSAAIAGKTPGPPQYRPAEHSTPVQLNLRLLI